MSTFEAISFLKTSRKGSSLLGGIIILLFFACHPLAEAKEQYLIKLATLAPEGSPWMDTFHTVDKEIRGKTGGKVKLRAYPGGVLGEDRDMLRKIRIGQIHGGGFTGTGLSLINEDIAAMGTPFLFENYGEVDFILDKMGDRFRRVFEEKGYVLLGWSEIGFVYLLSNIPIASVEEFRRAKVWVLEGDPVATPVLGKVGVTPIPLGIPDILMALQTNLVDVVYASPLAAIALQWFTKVKYMTDLPLTYSLGGVLVSKRMFGKIPSDLQKIIEEVFQRHTSLLMTRTRRDNDEAVRVMVRRGIKLVTPTAEETRKFKRISLEAVGELTGTVFPKDILAEFRSHLRQYREARKGK
jgi:TRAP-type C4-dicarboxylate transport system substrate-binding protein